MLDPELSELAEACGIERGYHDIWGVWHEASEDTVRALLSAMGLVDAASVVPSKDATPRTLASTLVLPHPAREIELRLGELSRADRINWRLVMEDGEVHEGEHQVCALRIAGHYCPESAAPRAVVLPLTLPPPGIPLGYHRLELSKNGNPLSTATLIVTPAHCYLPDAVASGKRLWGVSLQLYGVRSSRNWGIGDFNDLSGALEYWGRVGAAFIGVNPLHALYLSNPSHASPYSPSSRLFLNALYLDVEAIAEFTECAGAKALVKSNRFQAQIEQLRIKDLVDYAGVAALKKEVLELLHEEFHRTRTERPGSRHADFGKFCLDGGEPLRRYALFEALHEHFRNLDPFCGCWQQWPRDYHDPSSDAVAQFAGENQYRMSYFLYLQWQAAGQLGMVQERGQSAGLDIGLYLDLAVSIDRGGADAWAHQDVYALKASVGAPPDDFNPTGQDWGLPPFNPPALQRTGYALFIETLRANMAAAGALRIDHVMGLARLFWVPPDTGSAHGAYVRYPLEDLLAIVALESVRNRCMVIGEDLGTVPVQLRHALREWGVLSYRLLMFERDSTGRFQRPSEFPAQSMVAFSTHDLPTFSGYWRAQEASSRTALVNALKDAALLPDDLEPSAELPPSALAKLADAVHLYIARSPALMLSVQLDDLTGASEQANVPGTPDQAPNWRRKTTASLEDMRADARYDRLGKELCEARASGARSGG